MSAIDDDHIARQDDGLLMNVELQVKMDKTTVMNECSECKDSGCIMGSSGTFDGVTLQVAVEGILEGIRRAFVLVILGRRQYRRHCGYLLSTCRYLVTRILFFLFSIG